MITQKAVTRLIWRMNDFSEEKQERILEANPSMRPYIAHELLYWGRFLKPKKRRAHGL